MMELTVMTYNIHIGIPEGHNIGQYVPTVKDMSNLAKAIRESGAHIIGLNEVDRFYGQPGKSRSGYLHQSLELAQMLNINYAYGSTRDDGEWPGPGMTDYMEWGNTSMHESNREPVGAYGNAQLSQNPILYVHNFKLPMTPGNEQRCLLLTVQQIGDLTFHIYNAHFQDASAPHNERDRWAQAQVVARIIEKDDCPNKILMGDFNWDISWENEEAYQDKEIFHLSKVLETSGLIDSGSMVGMDRVKTYPSTKPDQRIDYIFVPPAFKVKSVEVHPWMCSDHRPVVANLEI